MFPVLRQPTDDVIYDRENAIGSVTTDHFNPPCRLSHCLHSTKIYVRNYSEKEPIDHGKKKVPQPTKGVCLPSRLYIIGRVTEIDDEATGIYFIRTLYLAWRHCNDNIFLSFFFFYFFNLKCQSYFLLHIQSNNK